MPEGTENKFNWTEVIAIFGLVLLTAVVTFGGTWYWMQNQLQNEQVQSDATIASWQARMAQYEEKARAEESTTASAGQQTAKTYTGTGYSVQYPTTWVNKVYSGSSSSLVAFADKTADLPADNSDQQAQISISTANAAATAAALTSDVTKATSATIQIGATNNIAATKWTLAAGRTSDLNGTNKVVIYEVKLANGSYVRLQNVNDQNITVFNQMLASFKLS